MSSVVSSAGDMSACVFCLGHTVGLEYQSDCKTLRTPSWGSGKKKKCKKLVAHRTGKFRWSWVCSIFRRGNESRVSGLKPAFSTCLNWSPWRLKTAYRAESGNAGMLTWHHCSTFSDFFNCFRKWGRGTKFRKLRVAINTTEKSGVAGDS